MHVDEFIDRYTPLQEFPSDEGREAERYARFVLMLMRLPAALQLDFGHYTPPLYCTRIGVRYRVVFASRMGWIGVTQDFEKDTCDERFAPDECSDWSDKP